MKCFYHTDMDGHCAGAIVYKAYKGKGEYIPINYKDDFPFKSIQDDEEIVIVDFSLQNDGDFQKLLDITKKVTWIDHHTSAIEKHKNLSHLPGLRAHDTPSGCELTWKYFFPQRTMPRSVQLLGDYDTWTFKYGSETKLFQLGIKGENTCPSEPIWESLLNTNSTLLGDLIEDGMAIRTYQDQRNAAMIKSFSFLTEFEGLTAICCNQGMTNSQLFESSEEDFDLMMPFCFDGHKYTVSIYTLNPNIDCAALAAKYGGGGHKNAAGFQCLNLPFKADNPNTVIDLGEL